MSTDSNHNASPDHSAADATDSDDARDTNPRMPAHGFRERHALKVLGGIMVTMFALVIVAQVGC